ncbi:hypothetical protein [Streptomyces bauhiniae]
MLDASELKEVTRDYLPGSGETLKEGSASFLSVDLLHGRIWAYSTDEYATVAPVLVGAAWHMRWSIPPVDNGRANALIDGIADHAQSLFRMASVRGNTESDSIVLRAGAGTAIDAIQRRCAAEWREHYVMRAK